MKITLLLTCLFVLLHSAQAQNTGKVLGRIVRNGTPAEGATVSLLRAKDSATVKLSLAAKDGSYAFENIRDGKYLVGVTAVGNLRAFSPAFDITPTQATIQLEELSLVADQRSLAGVTVTAKKPLIENKIDRTVVNVDASILNTGTSALEVLEKSPGILVDRDGNISLKGKDGVMVMVDGRPTQLSGADLANLLRNMHSNQLDQIEIMTNPPARYDAAGNSGIINIKTKKTLRAGFNGSANLSYTQGRYPKTAEGFTFNYRDGKVNLFTNLSHNYQKRYSILSINRNILHENSNTVSNVFNQEANRLHEGNSYSAKAGIDFFATPRTTFGAVVNLNWRELEANNPNVTRISDASKVLQSTTRAMVDNDNRWNSVSTNVNFRRLLDKKGKELTSDIDFVRHRSETNLFMVNSFTDANGDPYTKADTLQGNLPQEIKVYSARVDYLHPISKVARFEAGIKSSRVSTDNDAIYDSINYGRPVRDVNRSNHFIYEETIHAAYVNLSAPLSKKMTVQLGLRLEYTDATGRQLTTGDVFDRNYTQLFPTAYFQYQVNEKNNFGANFGRRVRRPSYQSLNPFIRFIDRYTYSQGNPALKPSLSNNFELSHSWKNQITTTLNYTYTKDIVQEIIQQKGQEAYNMPANVGAHHQFGISVNANTPLTKWWTSNIYVNAYHDNYKGVVNKALIDMSAATLVFNGTQQFKVTKTVSAELNGMFRTGGLEGVLRIRSYGFVGAGISKQILQNKGTLRLTARDLFHTQRPRGRSQYGNVDFEMNQVSETQVVTIGFTYNFSKGKKVAPVKRTAGSANEEQGRIGQ